MPKPPSNTERRIDGHRHSTRSGHRGAWPRNGRSITESIREITSSGEGRPEAKIWPQRRLARKWPICKEICKGKGSSGEGRPDAEIWPQRRPPPSEYLQSRLMYRQTASKRRHHPQKPSQEEGVPPKRPPMSATGAHNQATDGPKEGHRPPQKPSREGGVPPQRPPTSIQAATQEAPETLIQKNLPKS